MNCCVLVVGEKDLKYKAVWLLQLMRMKQAVGNIVH